jgi:NAD(P)H-nitrite reductase large subunit
VRLLRSYLRLYLRLNTVFLAGNGGANPKHAILFATDVPPSKVVRIIDRFIMYYIQTAVCTTFNHLNHN